MMRIRFLGLLFISLLIPGLLAAENVQALIIYAEGKGLTLIRGGNAQYLDFYAKKPTGFELLAGDIINVEARTCFEFQLYPTTAIIKVSESSSFTIKSIRANGDCDIDVMYGRLRAKADDKKAASNFLINGVDIATTAKASDFGYDMVFSADKELGHAVYCFGGSLKVSKTTGGTIKVIQVAPQEMVTVTLAANGATELAKTQFGIDVKNFWQKNDFQTKPVKTTVKPVPEETNTAKADTSEKKPIDATSMAKKDTKETEAVKTGNTDSAVSTAKKEVSEPGYLDNREGALGSREKLSAVGEKDIIVNPDFSKAKEEPVKTAPPEEAKEVKKEETLKEDAVKEEKKQEAESKPQEEQTTADSGGPSPVTIQMYFGINVNYISLVPPTLPTGTGDVILDFVNFLQQLQAGISLDLHVMFFDIFGFGIVSGIYYDELSSFDISTFTFTFAAANLFYIPILFNIRLTLFILFVDVYAGIGLPFALVAGQKVPGMILNGQVFTGDLVYQAGVKAGIKLGGTIFFASINFLMANISDFFTSATEIRFGGGIMFKLF